MVQEIPEDLEVQGDQQHPKIRDAFNIIQVFWTKLTIIPVAPISPAAPGGPYNHFISLVELQLM